MTVVQLTASRFFGGKERQALELARHLPAEYRSLVVLFHENGQCSQFHQQLDRYDVPCVALRHDTPHLRAAVTELAALLRTLHAPVLCCRGYKADIVGLFAARRVGVPVFAVAHGWTGENLKVRCYEAIDRRVMRRMDRVVCVSHGQAAKVRRAGVSPERTIVIHDAVDATRFAPHDTAARRTLESYFGRPPARIVGAAGRLSPEKGFDVLIEAARTVTQQWDDVGFVLFGTGVLRERLAAKVRELGLSKRFVLAGFRDDLDSLLPSLDALVLPSFTEGLPNVVLEAFAAGVPVVATAVGGTPELIDDGVTGYLVPPHDADTLARRVLEMLDDDQQRRAIAQRGRERVMAEFSFAAQSEHYQALYQSLGVVPCQG